jgi:hypothetical protein
MSSADPPGFCGARRFFLATRDSSICCLPDFLVRLGPDQYLLPEGKGRQTSKDDAKETATRRWVAAVNGDGRWGTWTHAVARAKAEVRGVIEAAMSVTGVS